jgi:hypothetical protein
MYLWVACQDITGKHVSISARMLREGLLSATILLYAAAIANGRGDEDTAAVCTVLESVASLSRAYRLALVAAVRNDYESHGSKCAWPVDARRG